MSHFIVLIILGVIGLINYLVRLSASNPQKPGGGPRPSNYPRPQRPAQTARTDDDERLRKFMEALGVPAASTLAPRKIVRPQQVQPRVQPVVRKQPPRQVYTPPPPVSAQIGYQTEAVESQTPVSTGYEVATSTQAPRMAGITPPIPAGATPVGAELKSLLKSSSSIRAAILLREILGAPKGLQAGDVIPGLR